MFATKSAITIFGILFLLATSLFLLGANHQQKVEWEHATFDHLHTDYYGGETVLALQVIQPEGIVIVILNAQEQKTLKVNGVERTYNENKPREFWDIFYKELAGTLLYNKLTKGGNWHMYAYTNSDQVKVLEIMGAKGWELIQHKTTDDASDIGAWKKDGDRYYFKRRKN